MKTPKGLVCDHIHHDTLDNQKSNLRNVTNGVNVSNRKSHQKNNILGILGVQKHGKGFRAHITTNRKLMVFPTRKTVEEAILDRHRAKIEYHGNIDD